MELETSRITAEAKQTAAARARTGRVSGAKKATRKDIEAVGQYISGYYTDIQTKLADMGAEQENVFIQKVATKANKAVADAKNEGVVLDQTVAMERAIEDLESTIEETDASIFTPWAADYRLKKNQETKQATERPSLSSFGK